MPRLRLLPDIPLPSYAYVPGRWPHPTSDPAGHSYGEPHAGENGKPIPPPDPARWQDARDYCRGIDLFNHGYYWEAHESWERGWIAAGRRGVAADFLKGLIKLAAAGVKTREGRCGGVRRHAKRAWTLFEGVRLQHDHLMGLALEDLIADAQWLIGHAEQVLNTDQQPVVITLPFTLEPREYGSNR